MNGRGVTRPLIAPRRSGSWTGSDGSPQKVRSFQTSGPCDGRLAIVVRRPLSSSRTEISMWNGSENALKPNSAGAPCDGTRL